MLPPIHLKLCMNELRGYTDHFELLGLLNLGISLICARHLYEGFLPQPNRVDPNVERIVRLVPLTLQIGVRDVPDHIPILRNGDHQIARGGRHGRFPNRITLDPNVVKRQSIVGNLIRLRKIQPDGVRGDDFNGRQLIIDKARITFRVEVGHIEPELRQSLGAHDTLYHRQTGVGLNALRQLSPLNKALGLTQSSTDTSFVNVHSGITDITLADHPAREFHDIAGYASFWIKTETDIRLDDIQCRCLRSEDRKSTRLNSSHVRISYAVSCLKKKT